MNNFLENIDACEHKIFFFTKKTTKNLDLLSFFVNTGDPRAARKPPLRSVASSSMQQDLQQDLHPSDTIAWLHRKKYSLLQGEHIFIIHTYILVFIFEMVNKTISI